MVYICTEDVFPSKRLQQLISSFNSKIGPALAKQLAVGDHIYVEHAAEKVKLAPLYLMHILRYHCLSERNGIFSS